eukprot:scaffold85984_cov20-Tisochrysis_lutea.AAC.2
MSTPEADQCAIRKGLTVSAHTDYEHHGGEVPPSKGFGDAGTVLKPTNHVPGKSGVIPGNAFLEYDVELLRVSIPPPSIQAGTVFEATEEKESFTINEGLPNWPASQARPRPIFAFTARKLPDAGSHPSDFNKGCSDVCSQYMAYITAKLQFPVES